MLVFADPHITDKNLKELDTVFCEIDRYLERGETLICLGDWYHNKRLTATELEFGTSWVSYFNNTAGIFYMIRGNHPMVNFDKDESSVEYFKHIGIRVVEDLILNNMYFGHKMTEKSDMFFNLNVPSLSRYDITTKELKKYRYSFLGHQHGFQIIDKNIYHIGAIIYNTFGEVKCEGRYIVKIEERPIIIQLKIPIPMIDIMNIKDLDNTSKNTKVRFIFNNFQNFKNNISKIQKYKKKFVEFKIKYDIEKKTEINIAIKKRNFGNLVEKWLANIKDIDIKKELEYEFKMFNNNDR
ncbi:hypothetical protein LCGC14_1070640 [marine sediment metagenome]|uniref:Calcineurin-like phosphoesterase domain-containing protein n=1 Tax=marine sediment metagenome TaxID=412755 RepID=A0A0F9Q1C8_9ZZZZ